MRKCVRKVVVLFLLPQVLRSDRMQRVGLDSHGILRKKRTYIQMRQKWYIHFFIMRPVGSFSGRRGFPEKERSQPGSYGGVLYATFCIIDVRGHLFVSGVVF